MEEQNWRDLKGVLRVQTEFRQLSASVGKLGFIHELSSLEDNANSWLLKLRGFDNDVAGERQLNEDLRRLGEQYGQDHILMQLDFPTDYPTEPFFARIVAPRCVTSTGHVTTGGSICLEALTCSGTPGSWQPGSSVESAINTIMINMIDPVLAGPGGASGPLRVDFSSRNPCRPYSSAQAHAAFNRRLQDHARLGWGLTQAAATSSTEPKRWAKKRARGPLQGNTDGTSGHGAGDEQRLERVVRPRTAAMNEAAGDMHQPGGLWAWLRGKAAGGPGAVAPVGAGRDDTAPSTEQQQQPDQDVVLVDLETDFSSLHPLMEATAAAQGVTDQAIARVMRQGVNRWDAVAALLLEKGSLHDAMLRAVTFADDTDSTIIKKWAAQCGLNKVRAAVQQQSDELRAVVDHVVASSAGNIDRGMVVKVERVEHPRASSQYASKRTSLIEQHSQDGLNEKQMYFITSNGAVVCDIAASGFDIRRHGKGGLFGRGLCFCEASTTALEADSPWALSALEDPAQCRHQGPQPLLQRLGLRTNPPTGARQQFAPRQQPPKWQAEGSPSTTAHGAAAAAWRAAKQVTAVLTAPLLGRAPVAPLESAQPPPGHEQHQKLLLARVILGRQAGAGCSSSKGLPSRFDQAQLGGETAAAAGSEPCATGCHVVFCQDQCCPEYVITLST